MTPPPRDFLFDIGNVILFFDFSRFARAIEDECDCSAEEIVAMLEDSRHQMEGATLSTEDFLRKAFAATGYRGTREKFIEAWQNIFDLNESMAEHIEQLHRDGHGLYLLSNTNQLHVDHFMNAFPVFDRFQGAVFSHEAGCAKPDPAIYKLAIEKFDLDPGHTIYLDDNEANVEAGTACGLRAIHYVRQSPAKLEQQLAEN